MFTEWLHQWLHLIEDRMAKKRRPKVSHRLRYGQGSFYWDSPRQVWRGVIEAGYDANGKRRRYTVSSRDEDTAWRKLTDKIKAVNLGQSVLTVSDAMTVGEWITIWLADRQTRVRPKTYATDAGQLEKWVLPKYGREKLATLSAHHVRDLARRMREAGLSTTTIRYTQRVWRQACTDARAEGYTVTDSFLLAKIATEAVSDRGAIPLEQAVGLVRTATADPLGTRWLAALLQGMRQGEALGLTWDAVDLTGGELEVSWQLQSLPYGDRERDTFRVPDGYEARRLRDGYHLVRPKSKAGHRVIPLIPEMQAALIRWRDLAPESPYGLVWPAPDGDLRTPTRDRAEWYALQDAAGISKPGGKPYVLHEARNTTATLLLAANVDPQIITSILGHSSIVTSRGYMTVGSDMKRDALAAVGSLLQIGE
ncbi:MAG: site-specific integrase [Trueperella sp.]|uniref:tyrosine-type recombinase/integrase n=1 Tax=Trueperella sp. TaxID=2699835 RepID=UPI0025D87BAB|nr:site-specific integrase [Trueperella sp.]MCI7305460.1 site-specific integrase [Trueperella sp.]